MTESLTDPLEPVRTLIARLGDRTLRHSVQKALVLWELGYIREALSWFRVHAERALRRLLAHEVQGEQQEKLEQELKRGQCARIIERLHHDLELIPARVALQLHTLLAWGNYASHHQLRGHQARPSDLTVLVSIAVDLGEWLATEIEGGQSLFDHQEQTLSVHRFEEHTIESGLDPAVSHLLLQAAQGEVQAEPHRLFAPRFSLELFWRRPAAAPPSGDPYRGLQAFEPQDAHRFYGRHDLCLRIEHCVDTRRLTILCGTSGSGKTSLLRAGLIPLVLDLGCGVLLLSDFSLEALGAAEAVVQRWPPRRPLVLVFDQVERTLLPEADPKMKGALVRLVTTAGQDRQGIRVVACVREDFLGQLLRLLEPVQVDPALDRGHVLVLAGPLSVPQAREAIVRPLEGTGFSYEEALLDEVLLPELAEGTDTTPSRLQIVCGRLLDEARARGQRIIDRALHREIGGADRILGSYLDQTLASAGYEGEQEVTCALLRAMTGPQARRWVGLGDLWQHVSADLPRGETDEVQLRRILDRLINDRLVVSRSAGPSAGAEYSLMHDQLSVVVRGWTSAAELERMEAQEHLERALALWPDPHRRELLRGRVLRLLERHWARLALPRRKEAEALLAASRRGRLVQRSGLGLLFAMALLGGIFGVLQLRQTMLQRDRMVQLADQGVILQAQLALKRDPTLAVAWLRNLSQASSGIGVLTLIEEAQRRGVASVLQGHEHFVTAVAFAPDGRTLASASRDSTVRLWDVSKRARQGPPLRGHIGPVEALAFAPDGRTLASAGADGTIHLWRMPTGRPAAVLPGNGSGVTGLCFSPDGRTLASAGGGPELIIWDLGQRRLVRSFRPGPPKREQALAVAFAPDGRTLAAAFDRTVQLLDPAAGLPRGPALEGHLREVFDLAFAPDGRTLASASLDSTVRLWDLTSASGRGEPLSGHAGKVLAVAFAPDGRTLASAGADKEVRLWERDSKKELGPPLRGHLGVIQDLAFSPDGRILASASRDHTVRLWDLASRRGPGIRIPRILRGHGEEVWTVTFSPDGRTLASASADRTVRLWDLRTRRPRGPPLSHGQEAFSTVFSPDGRRLACGGWGGLMRLWRLGPRPVLLATSRARARAVYRLAFSADGRTLAVARSDGMLELRDGTTLGQRGPPLAGHGDAVIALAFSPDGRLLASGGRDRTVRLWQLASNAGALRGRAVRASPDVVYSVAFSDDGRMLASGNGEGTIQLFSLPSLQPLGSQLSGHRHWVLSVAFSPGGKVLASGSSDGTVRLWSVERRAPLGPPLSGHHDWVHSVAFSPDGQVLASASADQTIWLWQLFAADLSRIQRRISALTNVHVSLAGRVFVR